MILGGVLFIYGLLIGSFINSFVWRYQERVSYKGRSMCPACKETVRWYDNLPIISWFFLSGKCRYCKSKISVQYPIVELLTALSFAIAGVFSEPGKVINQLIVRIPNSETKLLNEFLIINLLLLALALLIVAMLVAISVYDFKTKEIPNGFNLSFVIFSIIYLSVLIFSSGKFDSQQLVNHLVAALVIFSFFYSLVFFSKETWMGGGDAKLVIGSGLILGPLATFLMLMVASIAGSAYGLAAMRIQRTTTKSKSKRKSLAIQKTNAGHEIPFGPFLAFGTFVSLVFGTQIIDFYVKIILGF